MIDVLLPFYGDPELMREAVESVLAQESADWRMHVVDDATEPNSVSTWVAALNHPQVTYTRNETRLGVRANFLRCLQLARNPHITFMGCDDRMEPSYVGEVLSAFRRHPTAAATQPGVGVIDSSGNRAFPLVDRIKRVIDPVHGSEVVLSGESLAARLMVGNWLYFPAIAWRREVIESFSFRPMETALDLGLLMDIAYSGQQIVLTPKQAFCYRRHASSASSVTARTAQRFVEERALCREFSERCAARGWRYAAAIGRLRPTSRLHAAHVAVAALARGDDAVGRSLLRHALT